MGHKFVVIGGAGAMGKITVTDLFNTSKAEDEVIVADYDLAKAEALIKSFTPKKDSPKISAIKEGRTIFNNLQKFISYQISVNFAQLSLITLAILIGLPLPLVAIQILLMNLFSDELTAIALSFNPDAHDVMQQKPRKNSNILKRSHWSLIILAGSIMCLVSLGVFYYTLNIQNESETVARTTTLVTMIFFAITNAFNFRSFRKGVLNRSPFTNKYLVYASIISVLATILIIYSPLNKVFEIAPISLFNFFMAFVASLSIIFVFDILKKINNKKKFFDMEHI